MNHVLPRVYTSVAALLFSVTTSAQLFGSGASTVVGPNAYAVATADVSGDGRPDLVVSVYSGNRLAVLLGDGAGGFAAPVNYAVGLQPYHVAIADLNQDRVPDLVSANSGANTISVLLGSGGGAFAAPTNFAVGPGPLGVGVGDLNRDGKPDLAVVAIGTTSTMPSQIGVLLGNGAGGFSAATYFNVTSGARAIALGDLNRDGRLDAATANFSGRGLAVVFGNGTGGFGAATDYPTTGFMGDVALADLNSDGHLDLIGAASSGAQVYVLRNNGAGVFGPVMTVPASANASSVIAGDVDRDGFVDLIAGDASGNSIAVMRGIGGGAFAAAVTFPVGTAPRHLALTDLNADGTVDVLVANNLGGSVTRLLGNVVSQGLSAYGTGTAGFPGMLGMNANVVPRINTPGFRVACSNAPRRSAGTVLVGTATDLTGSLLFGLGVRFHVSAASSLLLTLGSRSDEAGLGLTALPIPADAGLQGVRLYAQAVWIEDAANGQASSRAALGLVASRGLEVTLQQ